MFAEEGAGERNLSCVAEGGFAEVSKIWWFGGFRGCDSDLTGTCVGDDCCTAASGDDGTAVVEIVWLWFDV